VVVFLVIVTFLPVVEDFGSVGVFLVVVVVVVFFVVDVLGLLVVLVVGFLILEVDGDFRLYVFDLVVVVLLVVE
jgi:hypothetical protein